MTGAVYSVRTPNARIFTIASDAMRTPDRNQRQLVRIRPPESNPAPISKELINDRSSTKNEKEDLWEAFTNVNGKPQTAPFARAPSGGFKYYRNGKPIRESSESTKVSVARDLLKAREGNIVRGVPVSPKMSRVRFDELAADMVTDYKVNEKRSLRDLEMRLKKHVLPFFAWRRAAAIKTADVNRFILRRQESGASNGEINRELTAVKRAFSLGVQAGKILAKPHIPMLRENNVRTGFFEREQFDALLHALPDYLQPVAQFAYITGWRIPSEVLKLQWS
jgi:hypothetical protein